jgi:hypothetical protein
MGGVYYFVGIVFVMVGAGRWDMWRRLGFFFFSFSSSFSLSHVVLFTGVSLTRKFFGKWKSYLLFRGWLFWTTSFLSSICNVLWLKLSITIWQLIISDFTLLHYCPVDLHVQLTSHKSCTNRGSLALRIRCICAVISIIIDSLPELVKQ